MQINPKRTSKFNNIIDNTPGKSGPRDPLGMAGLIWQGCYRTPLHLTGTYAVPLASILAWCHCQNVRTILGDLKTLGHGVIPAIAFPPPSDDIARLRDIGRSGNASGGYKRN